MKFILQNINQNHSKRVNLLTLLFFYWDSQTTIAQQANVNLDYNPHQDTEGLIPFSAPLNSPEVHEDRTVTFRLKAPLATEVILNPGAIHTALDKGNEPIPFTRGEDGIWSLTIGPLDPDIYAYHFRVDGMQIPDPSNTIAVSPPCPLQSTGGAR